MSSLRIGYEMIQDGSTQQLEVDRPAVDAILERVREGMYPDSDTFRELTYDSITAGEIVAWASQRGVTAVLSGRMVGDLVLADAQCDVEIHATVEGAIVVPRGVRLEGSLNLMAGMSTVSAVGNEYRPGVTIEGIVYGPLFVDGDVGEIRIEKGAQVGGQNRNGDVWGISLVDGSASSLMISGTVIGGLWLRGRIDGEVRIQGTIEGPNDIEVNGPIGAALIVGPTSRIETAFRCLDDARIEGGLALNGRFSDRVTLQPAGGPLVLRSLHNARFDSEVFVGNNVNIHACDFRQCPDLDKLVLAGADLFPKGERTLSRRPISTGGEIPATEMATIYRVLRTSLERQGNRAAAGDFYRGEMDSRLEAAVGPGRFWERTVVRLYRQVSGYGLIVRRALVAFALCALVGTALYVATGLEIPCESDVVCSGPPWLLDLTFTVRSMVGFFNPPEADLSTAQQWIQLFLRFVGPILIAQAVLATRERVAR